MSFQERIPNERWDYAIKLLMQTAAYLQGYWKVGRVIIERDLDKDNPWVKITILEPRYHTLDTLPREAETGLDGET